MKRNDYVVIFGMSSTMIDGIIIIKYIKLTNNMYEIKVPVIKSPIPIASYIITD